MLPETDARRPMRVLLRRRKGQYLQPSGEWSVARETAREFPGSAFAYYWALEQNLLGCEVLLAFEDVQYDVVTLRLR